LRVLHITTGLGNGGAEAALFGLVTGDSADNAHQIVSLTDAGYYGERLQNAGLTVHALGMPRGTITPRAMAELYRLIRAARADQVQTWMYHANLVGGVVARFAGARVIWSIHHSDLDSTKVPFSTRLVAHVCAWLSVFVPARIIYCSRKAADVHVSLGYSPGRTVVVNNGVDVQRFKPDADGRARVRAEWGIVARQVLLGMVARWDPLKDHATLFAALAHVGLRLPNDCRLVLVGPGMDGSNADLVMLMARFGVQHRVLLAGPRPDVPAVMNALDLHILSSSGEAFGNVSVEAMACGAPAIVTAAGAGAEIVGDTGWVVPVRTPRVLGEAIVTAIESMARVNDWSARKDACRARVIEQFSLLRMIAGYQKTWLDASAPGR
jgi:glycosyltransferase involved in cell wall biosynthesis